MKLRNPLVSSADKDYQDMYELYLKDNFAWANKLWLTILKTTPKHEKTLVLLAQIALQKKQRSRARERYNKLLEITPSSSSARMWRADASFGKKDYEAALDDYLLLYEATRKRFTALTKLGHTYAALQLDTIALRYYQQAVRLDNADMDARFALIKQYIKLRHYKDAEQEIQEAKDRYYHHKKQYRHQVFDEIVMREQRIRTYLHRSPRKRQPKAK